MNKFHTPPMNGGQVIEVSYLAKAGQVVRRSVDRSDRTTKYHVSKMLRGDAGDYWNAAPPNKRWKPMSISKLEILMGD